MVNYSIFTICTENYRDAYNFVISSWLNNTKADKIYIYTDDNEWIVKEPRISLIKILDKSNDWLKIVTNKTIVFKHFLNNTKIENSIFIDMDCYIRKDLGHVFEKDFDIAITRLEQLKIAVSTGVIFVRNKKKIKAFIEDWNNRQILLDSRKRKIKPRTCSNNQKAFSDLIRKFNSSKKLNVLDLDVDIYNKKAKPKRVNDLIKQEKSGKRIIVLHFYNNSYRDKSYVKQVIKGVGL